MTSGGKTECQVLPHVHSGITVPRLMTGLVVAITPSLGFGVFQYGMNAVLLIFVSSVAALLTELTVDILARRKRINAFNLHAVAVGLLISAMLPPGCPLPVAAVGASMAILLGKAPFGSLGGSFIAPAIVGMLVLTVSWPAAVNRWQFPGQPDHFNETYVAETPLHAVYADPSDEYEYTPVKMFTGIGKVGAIGTSSGLALVVGALLLVFLRITRMYATLGYLVGVCCAALIIGNLYPEEPTVWFHLTSGYALFAAMFLVNDIPASPVTERGMVIFGILSGALTITLRWAGVDFGAALFAVALSSLAIPFFDKFARKPVFQSEVSSAR